MKDRFPSGLLGIAGGIRPPSWLRRLAAAGIHSNDRYVRRRQMVVNVSALVGVADNIFHTAQNLLHAFYELMPISIYGMVMIVLFFADVAFSPLRRQCGGSLISFRSPRREICSWSGHLVSKAEPRPISRLAGLLSSSSAVHHWRIYMGVFMVALMLLLVSYQFAPEVGPVMPHDMEFRRHLAAQVMVNVLIISTVLIVYALTGPAPGGNRAARQSMSGRKPSLRRSWPRPIADRLKADPQERNRRSA